MTDHSPPIDNRLPAGRRLESPAFSRNGQPILEVLRRILGDRTGDVLEIGSGPGQHIVAFATAMPRLTWWPTDLDPVHLASIGAWREDCQRSNLRPAMALDATAPDWPLGGPNAPPASGLAAMLCINVVHIAPWAVAEGVIRAAGRHLAPDGCLILYGPYRRDGAHTAPSNDAFDRSLRARHPDWGVRGMEDVAGAAAERGLAWEKTVPMPSNNFSLVFRRTAR